MVSAAVYIFCNIAMLEFEEGILNFTLAFKLNQAKQNIN